MLLVEFCLYSKKIHVFQNYLGEDIHSRASAIRLSRQYIEGLTSLTVAAVSSLQDFDDEEFQDQKKDKDEGKRKKTSLVSLFLK